MSDLTVGKVNNVVRPKSSQKNNCPCCKNGNLEEEISDAKSQTPLKLSRLKHISSHVKGDSSIEWTNKELQDCIEAGICTKADALNYAREKEEGNKNLQREVISKLENAAKHDLTAIQIIVKNGSDNLTQEDKKEVASNLKESLYQTREITSDSSAISFLGNCGCNLYDWVNTFSSFIYNFFSSSAEDEKKQKEKLCEQRKLDKVNFYKAKTRYLYAKQKGFLLANLQKQLIARIKKARDYFENSSMDSAYSDLAASLKKENKEADYYKALKCNIIQSMPPTSVCNNPLNLELDLIC